MHYHMTCFVRGVLAPLTLVSAVPADGAVTLLYVLLQTILSQIRRVAYVDSRVENAFTWKIHKHSVAASGHGVCWTNDELVRSLASDRVSKIRFPVQSVLKVSLAPARPTPVGLSASGWGRGWDTAVQGEGVSSGET